MLLLALLHTLCDATMLLHLLWLGKLYFTSNYLKPGSGCVAPFSYYK